MSSNNSNNDNIDNNDGKVGSSNNAARLLFATVLVARPPNVPPSPLELMLRSNCQRLRVVEHLSGAHVLLPSGDSSLAVRAYFAQDCQRWSTTTQQQQQQQQCYNTDNNKEQQHGDDKDAKDDGRNCDSYVDHHVDHHVDVFVDDVAQTFVDWHQGTALTTDVDGLVAFRNSFKYSLVLLIVEGEEQLRQLSHANSFLHRVQGIMNNNNGSGGSGGRCASESHQDKMARVVIVPNVSSAMSVLTSIIETLKPAKRERKARYFAMQKKKWFLPPPDCHPSSTANTANTAADAAADADHHHHNTSNTTKNCAAELAAEAFREWATTKLSEGDENVILNILGTLKAVVTANDQTMETIPIDARSQHEIQAFFGSKPDDDDGVQQRQGAVATVLQQRPYQPSMSGTAVPAFHPPPLPPVIYMAPPPPPPQQQPPAPTNANFALPPNGGRSFSGGSPPLIYTAAAIAPPHYQPHPQQQQQRGISGW